MSSYSGLPVSPLLSYKDSLPKKRGLRKFFFIIKPMVNLDARTSYFLDEWVHISGFRLGFEMFEKYRFGWAFYASNPVHLGKTINDGHEYDMHMSLGYTTTYTDVVLHEDYRWEFAVSGALGFGAGTLTASRMDSLDVRTAQTPAFPVLELSGNVEYKIWPWLGIGAGFGGRAILPERTQLASRSAIQNAFNGPFYSYRLKIHFGPLMRYFFNRSEHDAEKEAWKTYRRVKKERRRNPDSKNQ